MAVSFSRTVRSLHSTNSHSLKAGIVVASVVFGLWCWWFVGAEIAVFEVTEDAWIEAEKQAHRTETPVTGRVVLATLEIGRWVEKDETLVVLSALVAEKQFSKEIERRDGAEKQLASLNVIRKMSDSEMEAARIGDRKRMDQARAELRSAEASASYATAELNRSRQLHGNGLLSDAELERADALLAQASADVLSLEAGLDHIESEILLSQSERLRAAAEIDNRVAALEAEEVIAELGSAELASEMEERTIKAPISGWLGRVSPCRPGSVLVAGDLIAVVIPDGGLKISGRFQAAQGLGRIEPGQYAKIRLHAVPWMRFSQIEAEVVRVGQETLDGLLSVECRIQSGQEHRGELQHGMQGTLMVVVDRMSPLEMVLTLAGRPWGSSFSGKAADLKPGERE